MWNQGILPEATITENDKTLQVHVITLKAYLAELALERALNEQIDDLMQVTNRIQQLLDTELTNAREFVEVTPDYVRVGINCDLIDDDAIMQAFRMMTKLPSFLPGTTIELGQLIQVYENKISRWKRAC